MRVVDQADLPLSRIARELEGADHGGAAVSLLFVEAPPGQGPGLHRHVYDELFVVQEGEATFFAGDERQDVRAGQVVIVPGGTPHRFAAGDRALRLLAIHASASFETEWLEA